MNSLIMTLLKPNPINHGVDVYVCRRTKVLLNGKTTATVVKTQTQALWVDLGYKSYREKNGGTKRYRAVEVHLYPTFNALVPGEDYIEYDGANYRIVSKLSMERMSGMMMYEVVLRDE